MRLCDTGKAEWFSPLNGPDGTTRWEWIDNVSLEMTKTGYRDEGQSIPNRVEEIADAFFSNMLSMGISYDEAKEYANYLYHMKMWGWNTFATPEWVSYGNTKGLPISCFGTATDDSMNSLAEMNAELAMLTKLGGGTSVDLSKIRPRGAKISTGGAADGPAHWAAWVNSTMVAARQGDARRGYCAAYLNGHHADVQEFVGIGNVGSEIHNITTGVVLDDEFMEKALVDPEYATRMAAIQESRTKVGFPYIMFADNVAKGRPDVYKDQGMDVTHSNLCSEIMLPNNVEESFVCVLASMNLRKYDQWKGTKAVRVLTRFLDTVIEESIDKIEDLETKYTDGSNFLKRVKRFLTRHRAIGLGATGLHHLYQSKSLPFGSKEAAKLNIEMFKYLKQETLAESKHLASLLGEPELLSGTGLRFATTMALAPTKSTAAILGGVSESIQPVAANVYIKLLAKTKYVMRNPELVALLKELDVDEDEVWDSITKHSGSVAHLGILTAHQKEVFKTYAEIDPISLIDQAATRQVYIDQGQSLNLPFHPDASSAYINAVTYYAWKMGIKSLYYQHNMSAAQALNIKLLNLQGCDTCGG